jgi:hypothetical protein
MTGRYTAYVLDPILARFTTQLLPDVRSNTIKNILGVEAVDTVAFDHQHTIYFNDDGLQNGITHYITIQGQPDPVVGVLILLANPDTGSCKPLIPIEDAASAFGLYRPVMDPIVTATRASQGDVTTFISTIEGFSTRTERFPIHIVARSS